MSNQNNLLAVPPSTMKQMALDCFFAGITPMVWGPPGVGKSEIIKQIAEELNLLLIDIRLTTCDITDLNGFPDNSGKKASYKVFDTFPIVGDELPVRENGEAYDGWLIFLDELPSVSPAMQASAYKLILDRMVGQHSLHKRCVLAAAGNDIHHGAISSGMGTAAGTRMCHINLEPSLEEWVKYATKQGIDHRIISFLQYKPDLLHNFSKHTDDKTHPNPRTWFHVSRLIKNHPKLDHSYHLPLVAGNIAPAAAGQFITYAEIYKDLVTFEEIVKDPSGCKLPQEAANTFAVTGVIIDNISKKTLKEVITYTRRLSFEFQVIVMRGIMEKIYDVTEDENFAEFMSEVIVDMT